MKYPYLPRLAAAYDRGLLVPFLGAGMSRMKCPDWGKLVESLEEEASIDRSPKVDDTERPEELIRRANKAVLVLRRRGIGNVTRAVQRALYEGPIAPGVDVPAQTEALVNLRWPLTLTTNYDDLFARAYAAVRRSRWGATNILRAGEEPVKDEPVVLGRGAQHCQRVLSSLTATTRPILWALQGHIPREFNTQSDHAQLEEELVVGHAEYRRVTNTALHFRRAFAEVFRRRSLLFLGSGLADPYLLDLFGEILELFGPSPLPHFALVLKGSINLDFLRSRFGIIAKEYDSHSELPGILDTLCAIVAQPSARASVWAYHVRGSAATRSTPTLQPSHRDSLESPSLEIIHGSLRAPSGRECVALSAGLDGDRPYLSAGLDNYLNEVFPGIRETLAAGQFSKDGEYIYDLQAPRDKDGAQLIGVCAWANESDRDIARIAPAARATFEWAEKHEYEAVRMTLLASGKSCHFPAWVSLSEMVRAFGRWCRATHRKLKLAIHVVDYEALFELTTDRLDVVELLTCDDQRFWVDVLDAGRADHELVIASETCNLGNLRRQFDIPNTGWHVEIDPRARLDKDPNRDPRGDRQTLTDLGVFSGSTVRFEPEPVDSATARRERRLERGPAMRL